jgi:flagella basal body P-ring formation protein FlgA
MNKRLRILVILALLSPAWAMARQDPAAIRQVIGEFLEVQTRGLPGRATYAIGPIDPLNSLTPCTAIEAFSPSGAKVIGRTTVGVRCRAEAAWTLYVPAQVRVVAQYVTSARPLSQGQVISAGDLAVQEGDLGQLPMGVLTDSSLAVGRTLSAGLAAGQPLRSDLLRQPLAVQQGQSVKVISRGPGFLVTTDGKAVANATDGQVAHARTATGLTLSGIARSGGVIEIGY